MITIEEMKQRFIADSLGVGLYTADDKIVKVDSNGFTISTPQSNGWYRVNIYEYIEGEWIESETYEK